MILGQETARHMNVDTEILLVGVWRWHKTQLSCSWASGLTQGKPLPHSEPQCDHQQTKFSVLQQRNESYKQEFAENKPLQPSTGPWCLGQQLEKKLLPQITDSICNAIASLKKMHRAEEERWSNSSLEQVQQQLQTIKSHQGYSSWHENMVILGVQKKNLSPKT